MSQEESKQVIFRRGKFYVEWKSFGHSSCKVGEAILWSKPIGILNTKEVGFWDWLRFKLTGKVE